MSEKKLLRLPEQIRMMKELKSQSTEMLLRYIQMILAHVDLVRNINIAVEEHIKRKRTGQHLSFPSVNRK